MATLERIVEHVLMTSDNDGAEVLLRQAAVAGKRKGTFVDGTAVVAEPAEGPGRVDVGHGWWTGAGCRLQQPDPRRHPDEAPHGGRRGREHPRLRPLLTGLPVAGVEGSLATKFGDDQSLPGRGVVRGKTGTLTKVHGLASTTRPATGRCCRTPSSSTTPRTTTTRPSGCSG